MSISFSDASVPLCAVRRPSVWAFSPLFFFSFLKSPRLNRSETLLRKLLLWDPVCDVVSLVWLLLRNPSLCNIRPTHRSRLPFPSGPTPPRVLTPLVEVVIPGLSADDGLGWLDREAPNSCDGILGLSALSSPWCCPGIKEGSGLNPFSSSCLWSSIVLSPEKYFGFVAVDIICILFE